MKILETTLGGGRRGVGGDIPELPFRGELSDQEEHFVSDLNRATKILNHWDCWCCIHQKSFTLTYVNAIKW